MKSSLIAGVYFLALAFTIANALKKKQDFPPECLNIGGDLQNCVDIITSNPDITVICGSCRSILIDYYDACLPDSADSIKQALDAICDGGGGESDPPFSECDTIDSDLQECLSSAASGSFSPELCDSCRTPLMDYYHSCLPAAADTLRQEFNQLYVETVVIVVTVEVVMIVVMVEVVMIVVMVVTLIFHMSALT